MRILATAFLMSTFAAVSYADVDAKKAFEKLKTLTGKWIGEAGKVEYKVTGAGSALVETLFPGENHEMVSVYHLDGDKLVMTHYCAAGNQPRMKLVSATENEFKFDFDGGANVTADGMHMHSLVIKFVDKDNAVNTWTSMAGGKPGMEVKFEIKRSK